MNRTGFFSNNSIGNTWLIIIDARVETRLFQFCSFLNRWNELEVFYNHLVLTGSLILTISKSVQDRVHSLNNYCCNPQRLPWIIFFFYSQPVCHCVTMPILDFTNGLSTPVLEFPELTDVLKIAFHPLMIILPVVSTKTLRRVETG